nr:EOG090X0IC1 [Ceriodaphnia reticulata]
MAFNIKVSNSESDEKYAVHSVPCKINHDGQANVKGFFSPYIEKKDSTDVINVLEASFRGYPLQGKTVAIPQGFKGITVSEIKKPLTDVEERNLFVNKTFSSFTYWNWDYLPTTNDSIPQCMDWLALSQTIHGSD